MTQLCYPYSPDLTCVCDASNRIYRCFPEISKKQEKAEDLSESSLYKKFCGFLELFNGRTETILAATCLLLILFAFCAFLSYRCEKIISYARKNGDCCNSSGKHYFHKSAQTDLESWMTDRTSSSSTTLDLCQNIYFLKDQDTLLRAGSKAAVPCSLPAITGPNLMPAPTQAKTTSTASSSTSSSDCPAPAAAGGSASQATTLLHGQYQTATCRDYPSENELLHQRPGMSSQAQHQQQYQNSGQHQQEIQLQTQNLHHPNITNNPSVQINSSLHTFLDQTSTGSMVNGASSTDYLIEDAHSLDWSQE